MWQRSVEALPGRNDFDRLSFYIILNNRTLLNPLQTKNCCSSGWTRSKILFTLSKSMVRISTDQQNMSSHSSKRANTQNRMDDL